MDSGAISAEAARSRGPLRVCLIGSGAISQRLTGLLAGRHEVVTIVTRPDRRPQGWWPGTVRHVTAPAELADMQADVVVEAAGRDAVAEWGIAALGAARKFVICSASALTDDALKARLLHAAGDKGTQLVIAHGALGGIQALSAAALLPLTAVTHEIRKPPAAWRGTRAEALVDLAGLTEAAALYEGSARDAAALYPANANAVVITALAGLGLERTQVRLIADPAATRNVHSVRAAGAFGEFSLTIANEPMASNPKTSEMTALSLVRLLDGAVDALVV